MQADTADETARSNYNVGWAVCLLVFANIHSKVWLHIACVMCLVGIVCNNAKSAVVGLNNRISGLKFKVVNRAYRITTGHWLLCDLCVCYVRVIRGHVIINPKTKIRVVCTNSHHTRTPFHNANNEQLFHPTKTVVRLSLTILKAVGNRHATYVPVWCLKL